MSYAAVTAHNAPPLPQQPHPDFGLLNTKNPHDEVTPDVDTAHVSCISLELELEAMLTPKSHRSPLSHTTSRLLR
jgi:hypothetical protein